MKSGCSADSGSGGHCRVGGLAKLVIPDVAAVLHLAVGAGAAHDDDVLQRLDRPDLSVHRGLDRCGLALAPGAVDGDEDLRLADLHSLGHGTDGEAAEHHVVHRADAGARLHRDDDLRDHRKVDADDVAGLYAERLQPVGELLGVAKQVGIRHRALLALLAVPVVGDAITAARFDVAVEAVVGDVQLAVGEPLVEGRVGVVEHLGEGLGPVDEIARLLGPELGDGSALGSRALRRLVMRLEIGGGLEDLDLEELFQFVLELGRSH